MLTIIVIVLVVLALGGFGHSGYQRGWYGRDPYYERPVNAGYGGGGLGLILVLVVLWLVFAHHRY
jgi:hypothetical protein